MKTFKKLLKIGAFGLLAMMILYIGIYVYARLTPKLAIDQANNFFFYDKESKLFTGNNQKEWISLDQISDNLIDATIAIEDKHFFRHQGFDFLRIAKSMYINITSGSLLQGASTITQQYARNLFLDFDKNWKRKMDEAWLTIRLESHYSKDEILEGYLNTINYGGIFGIENASQYYFDKSAKDLSLAEASILAGIPKDPTYFSPIDNEEASISRQKVVLASMVKNKVISEQEKEEALKQNLVFVGNNKEDQFSTIMYYQDAVIQELKNIKTIPTSFLKTGGLKIFTNLDPVGQSLMEKSMKENLKEKPDIQLASVMMDPSNGKVLALIGGRDFAKSQFNRAISAKRQVGSTMKPFLYYSALENGFTPSTTFTSEKTTFTFSENKTYSPQNYGQLYGNKPISMAAALAYSDNIYAVKTHLFLGEQTLVDTAKRVGIKSPLEPIPSLALGSEEINLMEMMEAYATLANEGYRVNPYFITKVEDIHGNVLYEHQEKKENVLNRSIVYVLNELLTNSYASELVDFNYPTCINLAPKLTKKYAIKTGTTNTDHLVFGYNKDVLIGGWMGYDDNQETETIDGTNLKNIWADTIETYLKGKKDSWYERPKNVVGVLIDPVTGKVANNETKKKKIAYYMKGTEPNSQNLDLDSLIPTIKETS